MKTKYINAIMWMFGFTKKQAAQYYNKNKHNIDLLSTILEGYNMDAKKAFYND